MSDYTIFVVIAITILLFFLLMGGFLYLGWWMQDRKRTLSPYTGIPLRPASQLSLSSRQKVLDFLVALGDYDNRMFNMRYASFCRETGRIFPDSITWLGEIKVDWTFLQKRYPGQWISWGSLGNDQQEEIKSTHYSLEGFQTENSCREPAPRLIEDRYVYTVPGPLYVDFNRNILLGWKRVPGTELEVLVVQKPIPPVV